MLVLLHVMSGDKEPYRNENSTAHWGPTGSLNTVSFRGEVWTELVLKPQTNRREDPWQRADGLLPDSPRWELCDHAALLLPKMAWFMPEGTLSPQIFSAPSCTRNVKSYKTSQPVKASPNSAVCNTATMWSQGAMHGKRDSARGFLRRPESNIAGYSCDVAFLGPAERAHVRAGEEGRRVYPIPRPTPVFCLQSVNIHLVGN